MPVLPGGGAEIGREKAKICKKVIATEGFDD
jgi:hypothetical protein